jgi:hypothetical protein
MSPDCVCRVRGARTERVMNELPNSFSQALEGVKAEEFTALRNSAALLDDVDFGFGGDSLLAREQAGSAGRVESTDIGVGGRQAALLKDQELGIGVQDVDYEEGDIATQGARQRWLGILNPLTVQPLTAVLPSPDRSLSVSGVCISANDERIAIALLAIHGRSSLSMLAPGSVHGHEGFNRPKCYRSNPPWVIR